MSFLSDIAAATRKRVEQQKQKQPLTSLLALKEQLGPLRGFPFEQALAKAKTANHQTPAFICELKKASPSKGLISADFPYLDYAHAYEQAGAAALSVLTEPDFFLGSPEYLKEVSAAVALPTLRKDFVIDEYQIVEARLLGASAVLLICALLPGEQLTCCLTLCDRLGLSALVEAHTADEVRHAVAANARIIGINNRDLSSFKVDLNTSLKLRALIPPETLFVSESGISTPEHVAELRDAGANAILVGEAMMRASDKSAYLAWLRGDVVQESQRANESPNLATQDPQRANEIFDAAARKPQCASNISYADTHKERS